MPNHWRDDDPNEGFGAITIIAMLIVWTLTFVAGIQIGKHSVTQQDKLKIMEQTQQEAQRRATESLKNVGRE